MIFKKNYKECDQDQHVHSRMWYLKIYTREF